MLSPKRRKTSSVGQSAGLLILRSSVRFRQKLKKIENSNLHGFEVHRPSSKDTKLLLRIMKAIIIIIISIFAAASNHLSYRVPKTPSFSTNAMVASIYCAFVTPIPWFWCWCATLNALTARDPAISDSWYLACASLNNNALSHGSSTLRTSDVSPTVGKTKAVFIFCGVETALRAVLINSLMN